MLGSANIDYSGQNGTTIATGSFGVHVEQMLFDGFQTRNGVLGADARVKATHEGLRNTEQNILFNAAAAYVDVIRDRQVATLRKSSVSFLDEQIRAAAARLEAGEATVTDVAQARASRAAALAQSSAADAQATGSAALYRQIVGDEPGNLAPVGPVVGLLPESLEKAISIALQQHPAIAATAHMVDASSFAVKAAEGALLPQVSARAGLSTNLRETVSGLPGVTGRDGTTSAASVGLNLTVPLYQGGRVSAQVRQEKERLSQARIEVDVVRDQVRQAVVAAWAQYQAARQSVAANGQLVTAARVALAGVIEERDVGQRTTLDVLNSQSDLITAQINLTHAERDVVAASYAILSAIGRLTVEYLRIDTPSYRPDEHYASVKNKWVGTTTPDGR